jgi:outer membrane protein TolC
MVKALLVLGALTFGGRAEVYTMTLRQAVETAVKQNPDVALARIDEEKARQGVRIARDPFLPHLSVGSGLAKTWGFPMAVEGSAPSIVQARASQFIFNRQQSFAVAQAKEDGRGAALTVSGKRDEVAYRVASLFLDAERAVRAGALARKDAESQEQVLAAVQAQVKEGRALPLTEKQAAYHVALARQTAESMSDDQTTAETALALALGYTAEDRVRPAQGERPAPDLPSSETRALETALESNKDLRKIESQIASKQLEIRGEKAARWPRVDLVAQYGLFAKFNNYEDYFSRFQRHNAELGMSFQLPLLSGSGVGGQVGQTQADIAHLRLQLSTARNQLSSDLQQSFREVKKLQSAAEVARLDLEVAREQVSVNLAQMQEGRLTMRLVEEARIVENQKWLAFYDAQYAAEKARWNLLRLTGNLLPAIQSLP